ncbi:M20 aminoacylase family protein [Oceaniglobus indicus]|uniref:M20 aminoacylase family protein n=1 Tax=Oceaniglobus indicus TaxID=2047749 RepID=UPI000C17ECA8|nr:M20 aminoacylase family protein [Oceaniglobus indicus]
MPVINRIADYAEDMRTWRHWLHRHPELGFALHRTAGFVAERLRAFGVDEIHEGIATTGIVALINGRGEGPTIGLRADMDALPIQELSGVDHASETPGVMHACGHDGHTTMLLGAARYLAETRNFSGRVALIFQPAEEDGAGGDVMVKAGIMERFAIARVFGMHNAPENPAGHFAVAPGPVMAGTAEFHVTVTGNGGHGAMPHTCIDPIPPLIAMVQAFDTIVSRSNKPTDDLVISVTQLNAGSATNVIPGVATFAGTVRAFDAGVIDMVERRMGEVVAGVAAAFGVGADLVYDRGYPPTINDPDAAALAALVASDVVGAARVGPGEPVMGAEDFAYMLAARPGAYLFLGQGDTPFCHHPAYDFNDAIAPVGASFFARLVEVAQPRTGQGSGADGSLRRE